MRELKGWSGTVVSLWLAAAALFHLYTAAFGTYEPRIQRGIHLGLLLPAGFLLFPATKKSPRNRFTWFDFVLAVLAFFPPMFLVYDHERIDFRFETVTEVLPVELILGTINVIILLEAVRRFVVPAMMWLAVVFIGYMFAAPYLPGMLHHEAIPFDRMIEIFYLLSDEGIYGQITGVSATFVALFVIFGAFIHSTGTGKFFTDLACRLAGGSRGGPAKIAVVSSGLFGTISGVAAANVYATGTFTIPMMRKLGYRRQFAGAVEAAASTGGMLMPPIMGAGAFVMAEITGIPYITICKAAAVGAILYYVSIGFMVHFEAVKNGLRAMLPEEIPSWRQVSSGWHLIIPLVGLVYLLVKGYSPFWSAFVAIVLTLVVNYVVTIFSMLLTKSAAPLKSEDFMTPVKIFEALAYGGRNMIMIAAACAGAGLIIAVITYSGLGLIMSSVIVSFSHGIFYLACFFIMIASIILGMGLPCTPAYIIAVSIGGPTLLKMGGDTLPVHLFVFYFAILAGVTPPVSIAAYAGAALAGTNPIKTGFEAFRLAIAGFIVPYVFIRDYSLLLQGPVVTIVLGVLVMLFSVLLIAAGLIGHILKPLPFAVRAGMVMLGGILPFGVMPRLLSLLLGFAAFAGVVVFQKFVQEKTVMAPAPPASSNPN